MKTIKPIDPFFKLWAVVMPVSSFSLLPSIQGTTPAYMLALLSIPLVLLLKGEGISDYIKDNIKIFWGLILIVMLSQLCLMISSDVNFLNVPLIDYEDRTTVMLRSSMFTQLAYLVTCIATFTFVRQFYNESWDKAIRIGAVLLALYGLYEVAYFYIFNASGDFVSNRIIDGRIASLTDITTIAGITLMRLKSYTGEPSMYALTALPYWIYLHHKGNKKLAFLLLITLLLTTSGTALLGILVYVLLRFLVFQTKIKYYFWGLPISLLTYLFFNSSINHFVQVNLIDKINMDNGSGVYRFWSFTASMDFYNTLNILQKFFGVGYGYIRSTDLLSTVLVNNGVLGIFILLAVFLYPVFKLDKSSESVGIKLALCSTLIIMLVSVPELYYSTTWMFLGIAYFKVRAAQKSRVADIIVPMHKTTSLSALQSK